MGRLAKNMKSDIDALESGDVVITESPLGDRGEPRPPVGQPNGRILLRLSRREHATLVQEAADQGVSLNHYLTEIVCGRRSAEARLPEARTPEARTPGREKARGQARRSSRPVAHSRVARPV